MTWRLGICILLLAWIFHAIFMNEGRRAFESRNQDWSRLSRLEQWQEAWTHGPEELWQTIHLVEPVAFTFSLVFMGATIFLGVLRWRMVLNVHGLHLPLGRATSISMVAQFFNSFLLGSTGGDLLKAYYAARETHHKKTEAVVTVFVDRLLGLLSMLLFACLMMLPNLDFLRANRKLGLLAGFIAVMMFTGGMIMVLSFWGGVSRQLPQARMWLRRLPKGELLERCLEACRVFGRRPEFLIKAMALSMLLNIACVLQFLALAKGLQLEIPVRILFLIVPMIICISALPITPSGLGVRENLYVLALTVPMLAIDPTKALSLSLLAYFGFLVWSVLGGLVYLGMRESQHLDEVARVDATLENYK